MKLKSQLSFTTFNLYNLNEAGLPMYRNRAGWSAAMLQRAKADLFGFQKLWHRDALVRVLEAAKLADDYALIAPDDHRGHRT